MFSRIRVLSILLPVLLLCGSAVALAGEVDGAVDGQVRWSGEVLLSGPVSVAPKGHLQIAPGTVIKAVNPAAKLTVRGVIEVLGTAEAPVVFATPAGWAGIEFLEAAKGSRILYARFKDPEAAISSLAANFEVRGCHFEGGGFGVRLLRESGPLIEDNEFVGTTIGVNNEMRSFPVVRNNLFEKCGKFALFASHNSRGVIEGNRFEENQQAIYLMQPYPDRIADNDFVSNEVGIYCNQTKNTPLIEQNRFEHNQRALYNGSFSYPAVRNNRFTGNQTAIRNEQYGSPLISHNSFVGNATAIYNYRKSNPQIEQNQIEESQLALYCDYSSYPKVRNNNFLDNQVGVQLGIYQSADWEKRAGSKGLMLRESKERNSRNPMLSNAPTEFHDVVDVSHNWWGKQTALLAASGADGNLDLFYDRHDKATVVYEGFGPEAYALDVISYAPWLESPVADAGPQP